MWYIKYMICGIQCVYIYIYSALAPPTSQLQLLPYIFDVITAKLAALAQRKPSCRICLKHFTTIQHLRQTGSQKKIKKSIQPFWWHLFSFVDHVPLRHLFWYETLEVFPMYEYKPKHTIRYHSFITYLKASHWRFRESSVCAILLDESLKLFRIGSGSPRLDMTASCYGDPCVINKQRMFFSKYPYGLWSPLPKLIKTGIHVQGGTNNLNLHLLGAMSVFATKKSSHFGNTSQVHHLLSELLPYWSGKFYSNVHLR